jgi:hypothetical protein
VPYIGVSLDARADQQQHAADRPRHRQLSPTIAGYQPADDHPLPEEEQHGEPLHDGEDGAG